MSTLKDQIHSRADLVLELAVKGIEQPVAATLIDGVFTTRFNDQTLALAAAVEGLSAMPDQDEPIDTVPDQDDNLVTFPTAEVIQ